MQITRQILVIQIRKTEQGKGRRSMTRLYNLYFCLKFFSPMEIIENDRLFFTEFCFHVCFVQNLMISNYSSHTPLVQRDAGKIILIKIRAKFWASRNYDSKESQIILLELSGPRCDNNMRVKCPPPKPHIHTYTQAHTYISDLLV